MLVHGQYRLRWIPDRTWKNIPNWPQTAGLFEDREIVPARGIEAVRGEVAEGLAAVADLMMIPHISDRRRVVRVNLSLDKGLLDTLDEAARIRGMTHYL